ncbi:2-succinyl-5-enolpyruvyl-6-hydroxy-3-cyclohexene-1-carboxylic-acid synthase [Nesterenkonia alkaliphila]|uniref:2-succinyl-5-enolpyruvyl-6-hydroxy-3-cyclohexene-1-carboxylate synthase n=2 Tax=Nesterenkonia alkaliphila TaxID=1463631 RepID=A0A7K1UFM6_9MICC|nr:2-succinyl-5-enolpyruvyl-6-hydroxy-3-cyclohexene-1-carboxylic-acid synthase [Nesterenkonia alkaliphila]GFZ91687.1 2-succinyl-5-enolpyruvyl-6-hydroxy-3-cyclohexene-1-carboxylate synthase [Nesterenkonia alkaliphila]
MYSMAAERGLFREFDDSRDSESLRLARRVIRGLTLQMRHVVLCPGSRSAPLAYALAEAEQLGALTLHIRTDERAAAFTALGIALATAEPAGVVTTSGTAAGNLLPAVMEADMSGVPLVAITADRPEALHGTGANQTVWQQGMFTGRVRDELALEQSAIAEGTLRLEPVSRDDMLAAETQTALLLRAATTATARSAPGPVHLNIGFADPLVPAGAEVGGPPPGPTAGAPGLAPQEGPAATIGRWARRGVIPAKERERMYSAARPEPGPAELLSGPAAENGAGAPGTSGSEGEPRPLPGPTRTLFVMGHAAPPEAIELARALGHPMLAEPTSGARWSDLGPVQGYRLLLQSPEGSAAAQLVQTTERVVVAGRPTLTRPVQRLISRQDLEVVQYAPQAEPWHDQRLPRRVITTAGALAEFAGQVSPEWARDWEESGLKAQGIIDSVLREEDEAAGSLSSVRAAQFVAETVRTPLLLGSSSVIRDVDLAAALTRGRREASAPAVLALRGIAGIDGNISAAAGMALAAGQRVTALVGDLTFLHDANALLIPATERPPNLDVVVINDAGGAIFDQLEHGEVGRRPGQAQTVERLFGTPQTVDIEALADAYQHEYLYAEDLGELGRALAHPDDRLGIRIIETRTDRSRLRDLHARIAEAAAQL